MILDTKVTHSAITPKRRLMPIVVPFAVLFGTVGLVAWSAWPVLRPVRTVEIVQAVFVHAETDPEQAQYSQDQIRSTRTVQAAGWLEAEPFYTAATALADGVVSEMLVLEGDAVRKGQVLARLVDDDAKLLVARAQAELLRSKASRAQAQSMLTAAQQNWEFPYELERRVSSQKALLEERRAELAQLPELISEQESLSKKADEELKSIDRAYQGNAAAEIEYITARELANAQRAKLESIRAMQAILLASLDRIDSDVHAAERGLELRIDDRERLDSAIASFDLAEAQVAERQAMYDEAALQLNRMTIRSPIAGYVQRRFKVPGDKVIRMMDSPNSAHIAYLYEPSKLQVRVDVPLADASQILFGQHCEVVVEVLPERIFKGEVVLVTHEADLQKNTLQVKVRVIDPDPVLRPEMLTRVKFLGQGDEARSGKDDSLDDQVSVRVPKSSVVTTKNQSTVWVIEDRANGRGVLRAVPVQPFEEQGDWVTIRGELHPGSLIAADPDGCRAGQVVELAKRSGGAS